MFSKSYTLLVVLVLSTASLIVFAQCGKDEEKPEIVGCNSIRYKGNMFGALSPTGGGGGPCREGLRSTRYSQRYSVGGGPTVSGCFEVTCKNGCIESAVPCEDQSMSPTAPFWFAMQFNSWNFTRRLAQALHQFHTFMSETWVSRNGVKSLCYTEARRTSQRWLQRAPNTRRRRSQTKKCIPPTQPISKQ